MTVGLNAWVAWRHALLAAMVGTFAIGSALTLGFMAPAPTTSAVAPHPVEVPSATMSTPSVSLDRVKPAKWSELSADQQSALAPLSQLWNTLPSTRQLKWLAVAADFKKLSMPDQAKLQGRMKDWAALNAKQRDQARIGFSSTKALSSEDKRLKWEAYQALSPEAKATLAAQGEKKVGAAAKPSSPVPRDKKVNMPVSVPTLSTSVSGPGSAAMTAQSKPKLANVTESVSPQTLLPNPHP
jgi:hypothetical protein